MLRPGSHSYKLRDRRREESRVSAFGGGRDGDNSTGRIEAFSDGVFAIAITLLVIEIGVPHVEGTTLFGALVEQWPSYLA